MRHPGGANLLGDGKGRDIVLRQRNGDDRRVAEPRALVLQKSRAANLFLVPRGRWRVACPVPLGAAGARAALNLPALDLKQT